MKIYKKFDLMYEDLKKAGYHIKDMIGCFENKCYLEAWRKERSHKGSFLGLTIHAKKIKDTDDPRDLITGDYMLWTIRDGGMYYSGEEGLSERILEKVIAERMIKK